MRRRSGRHPHKPLKADEMFSFRVEIDSVSWHGTSINTPAQRHGRIMKPSIRNRKAVNPLDIRTRISTRRMQLLDCDLSSESNWIGRMTHGPFEWMMMTDLMSGFLLQDAVRPISSHPRLEVPCEPEAKEAAAINRNRRPPPTELASDPHPLRRPSHPTRLPSASR
jgi:hypothetical protein